MTLRLPDVHGVPRAYAPRAEPLTPPKGAAPASRTVFAAAHVVADPRADLSPGSPAVLDWDATLAFRRHLWAHGLGVAEAMDTAQRGTGLDWTGAAELIRRSAAEARAVGGRIACGAGTDQLPGASAGGLTGASAGGLTGPFAGGLTTSPARALTASPARALTGASAERSDRPAALAEVRAAYEEQIAVVEESGAQVVLMASRALAAAARDPEDYLEVYGHLLRQCARPVILHWLGPMFDPALEGYWGTTDPDAATRTVLDVIAAHPGKVDGVKISLLDAGREIALRRLLPDGVRCYTGDDFHYPELIAGDGQGFSHALLGVFDPLGPLAAHAVRLLDAGDVTGFRSVLDPTVALARHLFAPPTRHYKTGVVLLAWLAGHQSHFTMPGGHQSSRSLPHLARAYELADGLGLFPHPELAERRMRSLLTVYGVAQ
ncbi:dihydrodipicolinate synthase family protein [Streptomyces sp. NPDC088789]|uniref:dihydrodipicolinate synthase family protein n=1 Tax=Streptomyces sp. NPDC088789 TaxID=3365899 RepID=UPI0038166B9E